MRKILFLFSFLIGATAIAQVNNETNNDSVTGIKKTLLEFSKEKGYPLTTGYFPVGFFDIDLKTLVKYNNHEGLRLGVGGLTNDKLFEKYRFGGYVAYGFKDEEFKYSLGGSARVNKDKKTWISLYYTDDIKEIGTYDFLTDARFYSLFEPRLLNVIEFYDYKEWQANIQSELSPSIWTEFRVAHSDVNNFEDYYFIDEGKTYNQYKLAEAILSFRVKLKTDTIVNDDGNRVPTDRLPKISTQITKGFKDVAGSDFNYAKFGLKLDYEIKRKNLSSTSFILQSEIATGDLPLTHLFHAFPNQPIKETVFKRFSVAGVQSFETMYFGEFFSDKLAMLQMKHTFRRFRLAEKWNPELVLISRHAIGDMKDTDRHFGIPFNTLDHPYNEAGLELNKIALGFGLSFAYRYGYYSLPNFEDNISFKFTFNLKV
ncbi:DUF5686 family protein [Aequorivita xiaoshiensis]|uniref:DUF5686 family protein n=1 Tax=Aequorivita xiaoshiensis TaxID=2874476 RepID=A0A9X1R2E6_9FLAO|nr:DUF5686 family protein [Aequorivita xiaoshiensis]MCG2430607.1 DUF5686 family protein [Aequorivita xiaoshiensis]